MGITTKKINLIVKIIKPLLPYVVLLSVWGIFIIPYVFQQRVPYPSRFQVTFFQPWQPYFGMPSKNNAMPDIITQIYPWKNLSVQSLKSGGTALWNPYSFSGTVHLANYQSSPYAPTTWLYFFLPFLDAWSLSVLLQPIAAGFGMFLFLRSIERTKLSSLLGAIAFMFCGFMTTWMAYGTLGWAVVFLPFILFALENISKQEKRWWYGIILAGSIAASFTSGHFQMSLYVAIISMAYSMWKGKKTFLASIPFFLAGFLLSTPQLLPTFSAFLQSNRSESFITNAGIPWNYLITLFAPDFFGNPVTRNDWFGQYAEWASYIGVLPLLFACVGVWYVQKRQLMFFLMLSFVCIILATLNPISNLFYSLHLPVLSTSVATRLIVFVSFSCIVFSTFGIDYFLAGRINFKSKRTRWLLFACICVFVLVWGNVLLNKTLTPDQLHTARRNIVLPSVFFLTGMAVIGIGRWKYLRMLLICGVIGLTSFDMLRFASKWMPFEEREYVFKEVPLISFLQQKGNIDRVFSPAGNEMHTYYSISSIEGYDAMYQERYGEFISAATDGTIQPLERSVVSIDRHGIHTNRIFSLLGVKYVVHRLSDGQKVWVFPHWLYPQYRSIYKDDHYEVFENTESLPRAYVVGSAVVETDKHALLAKLFDPEFPIVQSAIIEQPLEQAIKQSTGSATITHYSAEKVLIQTNSNTPQLLVLSDVYDPGWQATVNGKPAKLYRTNYAFRGVEIPAGKSEIQFNYRPLSFEIGRLLFIITSFVLFIGSVRQYIYERRIL